MGDTRPGKPLRFAKMERSTILNGQIHDISTGPCSMSQTVNVSPEGRYCFMVDVSIINWLINGCSNLLHKDRHENSNEGSVTLQFMRVQCCLCQKLEAPKIDAPQPTEGLPANPPVMLLTLAICHDDEIRRWNKKNLIPATGQKPANPPISNTPKLDMYTVYTKQMFFGFHFRFTVLALYRIY